MRKIDTTLLSGDECWAVQINGLRHCENCKFQGLTACAGQNIRQTGMNNKGVSVGKCGIAVQVADKQGSGPSKF